MWYWCSCVPGHLRLPACDSAGTQLLAALQGVTAGCDSCPARPLFVAEVCKPWLQDNSSDSADEEPSALKPVRRSASRSFSSQSQTADDSGSQTSSSDCQDRSFSSRGQWLSYLKGKLGWQKTSKLGISPCLGAGPVSRSATPDVVAPSPRDGSLVNIPQKGSSPGPTTRQLASLPESRVQEGASSGPPRQGCVRACSREREGGRGEGRPTLVCSTYHGQQLSGPVSSTSRSFIL